MQCACQTGAFSQTDEKGRLVDVELIFLHFLRNRGWVGKIVSARNIFKSNAAFIAFAVELAISEQEVNSQDKGFFSDPHWLGRIWAAGMKEEIE